MKQNNKLSETAIKEKLRDSNIFTFYILESTDSTNTEAKKIAENGAPEGTVVIAESQTLGKGRMNRRFSSPKGTGIYMSLILRPQISAEQALMITTAAAVAVAEAIERLTDKKAGIKWVNDIYTDEKKVCGILTEAAINTENKMLKYAILGIGINASIPEEGFSEELKDVAGALYEYGKMPESFRNKLIAEVLNVFHKIYKTLPANEYMKEYRSRSILTGQPVNILNCGEICGEGIVEDIDDNCGIVIRYGDGRKETLSSGEVSIKKKV